VQLPDKAVALTSQDLPLVTAWQRLLLGHHQQLPANSNESSKKRWTYIAARLKDQAALLEPFESE